MADSIRKPTGGLLSTIFRLILMLFSMVLVKPYPQPCRYPSQYEGRRFQTSYFDAVDEFVAVDCEKKLMYTANKGEEADNGFSLIDLTNNTMSIFDTDGTCYTVPLTEDQKVDYCGVAPKAEFTGTVSLAGRSRQGWVMYDVNNYEQTTVVTRDKHGGGECLPFINRKRTGNDVIAANIFYDITSRISEPSLFDIDTTKCSFYSD
ncbi:hypothetical protein PoB_002281800 [Plakobranchus ocellatus]|uniref:Uncharacterized protein n=1 Tax=Plakobranchus ocellatus TaxID=259542 RepID=A0AAV3ZP02_9GAST|nr:hypothetical protein PoB_002281800 [Plakobranchus ocellatus]